MRFTLTALLVVPLVSLVVLWGFGASLTVGNALQDRTYNHLVSLTGARYYDQLETQLATRAAADLHLAQHRPPLPGRPAGCGPHADRHRC